MNLPQFKQNTESCTKSGNISGGVLDYPLYPRLVSPGGTILDWFLARPLIFSLIFQINDLASSSDPKRDPLHYESSGQKNGRRQVVVYKK